MTIDPRAKPVDVGLYKHIGTSKIGTMEWAPLDDPGSIEPDQVGIFWPTDGTEWDYVRADEIEALRS